MVSGVSPVGGCIALTLLLSAVKPSYQQVRIQFVFVYAFYCRISQWTLVDLLSIRELNLVSSVEQMGDKDDFHISLYLVGDPAAVHLSLLTLY